MTVPYQYINNLGIIVPQTSDILGEVQAEYKTIFGADMVVTPDTPQGVLITAQTLARTEVVNNNAALANQINPNIAGGIFLDAIMALTGMQRTPATNTFVPAVTLTGVAGTVISAGTQAKTSAGDIFQSLDTITLNISGNGTVDFASIVAGAIPCATHALNTIVTNILGWETVDNTGTTVLGTETQSDQAARALRLNTLAFQGVALPVAITSALYAVPGVTSLQFLENYNSVPMGMIIKVTDGSTLAGDIFSMTTTDSIVVGTDAINFAVSTQTVPQLSPWPDALFATKVGNITLSGLSTQSHGDWPGSLTGGNIILVKHQTSPDENGLWLANASTWTRHPYNADGSTILGSNSGISLIANSVWNCVNGGLEVDIAASLLENKSSGCAWNGENAVSVIEPASGQIYTVLFDRPTTVSILVKVTTSNGSTDNIKQAVVDYSNGLISGFAGFVVGADVSPFEISGAILSRYPNYLISKVEVSLISPSYSTNTLPIALNEVAFTQLSYVSVVIS